MNINKGKKSMKKIVLLCILLSIYGIAGDYKQTKQNKGDENMEIEKVWEEYIEYWKKHEPNFTAPETCKPNSKKEVEELEKSLGLKLPDDFKVSLQTVSHVSKKCTDNYYRCWFGNQSSVDFLPLEDINGDKENFLNYDEIDKDKNFYYGGITHVNGNNWPKEWVPFANFEHMYMVIDLRQNIGNQYGQILVFFPYAETKEDGFSNRVAFVAKSYTEFMKQALGYIKKDGEHKGEHFLELLHMPKNYYDEDYRLTDEPSTVDASAEHEIDKAMREIVENGGWNEEIIKRMSEYYPPYLIDEIKKKFPKK